MIFASTMLVRGRPSPVDVTPQVTDEQDAAVHKTIHQSVQLCNKTHNRVHNCVTKHRTECMHHPPCTNVQPRTLLCACSNTAVYNTLSIVAGRHLLETSVFCKSQAHCKRTLVDQQKCSLMCTHPVHGAWSGCR